VYSGLDNQKTSQLNPDYSQAQPIQGDRYLATDTGVVYMLKNIPFTSPSNWILLNQGGVQRVNGYDGQVVLNTDDVQEGLSNKYFDSGIANYKAITVN